MKACKNCHTLTDQELCPNCGGALSREWHGYLIVLDARRSEIAKKMNVIKEGKFALKVK
ncbi:MAG: transcription elongation factor subunit Spt4 [Candidatus Thermoplasmatota archaeon]|nr:transcription elongation factor subunit Spt4 [Candidatus Thermoplasmatota archaeon]MDI6887375.1 transcription elongation factor subunit Spt4 [Candidatus Thermoplasmatota archaeon]